MLNWAKLPAAFIQDRRITLTEFRVYAALLLFRETEEGHREPTYKELAEFIGIDKSSVSEAIAGLKGSGWLRREIGGGRGKKSKYWLNPISTEPDPGKVGKSPTFSEPEKVGDLPPLSNEKGWEITPPLEPERLVIFPPFSDGDTIYKRNKEEKSKERVKTNKQEPEFSELKLPRKKTAADLSEITLPDWIPPDIWQQWIAYRAERKPALTVRSAQMTITNLTKARQCGHTPENLIATAIANGWQGCVFDKHLTGVTYDHPRLNGYQPANARISAAERKRIDDEQIEAFLAHGITPCSPKNQPEKDITATAVRID
jgi:hypothetical protein